MIKTGITNGYNWSVRAIPSSSLTYNPELENPEEMLTSMLDRRTFQITATVMDSVFAVINGIPADAVGKAAFAAEQAVDIYLAQLPETDNAPENVLIREQGYSF